MAYQNNEGPQNPSVDCRMYVCVANKTVSITIPELFSLRKRTRARTFDVLGWRLRCRTARPATETRTRMRFNCRVRRAAREHARISMHSMRVRASVLKQVSSSTKQQTRAQTHAQEKRLFEITHANNRNLSCGHVRPRR